MKWTSEKRKQIFDRTSGKCHICHELLKFTAYGEIGKQGGWEVEHSNPRSKGGTDKLGNLYPAHIKCNRSKGSKSTLTARRKFNKKRAPLSIEKRIKSKLSNGFSNGATVALVTVMFRVNPAIATLLTISTVVASYLKDPDDD